MSEKIFEQVSQRPKSARSVNRNQIDMMGFFNSIVEDLQDISDRLYLLENSLHTSSHHRPPRSLSSVRHREAIKLAREKPQ